jgi:dihydrofolate synthase / folylpolyglutamate synthase
MLGIMTYDQAVKFLSGLTDYEKSPLPLSGSGNYDLRRMEELLQAMGNPHKGRKTVHIAGTKGKGSTSSMIAGILAAAGYKTGLFTSPHLFSWQERIALNGRQITKKDFTGLAAAIRPYVLEINSRSHYGRLTTFEVLTAMAFAYFCLKNVDIQVLEVGMGGRLDSTNVANGDVCVITSISLDHTQVLGDTVEKIAGEKAGIIKSGSVVISAPQTPVAAKVIARKCRLLNARLTVAGSDLTWKRISSDYSRQVFSVKSRQREYQLSIPLLGDHQLENATCAIAAVEALQTMGLNINYREIVRGMADINWPARLQILGTTPLLVIDGAHNVYSVRTIISSIKKYFKYKKAIVIFGSSSDKDIRGMARELAGFASHMILTASKHARAASPDYLKKEFIKAGLRPVISENSRCALADALERAGKEDIILVTGSLFLAAEIKSESDGLGVFG